MSSQGRQAHGDAGCSDDGAVQTSFVSSGRHRVASILAVEHDLPTIPSPPFPTTNTPSLSFSLSSLSLARLLARWPESALDVIVVTKEGTSYLHGYEDARSDKPAQMERAIGAAKSPSPPSNTFLDNMDEDDDDDEDLTSEEDDDSSDDDDDDGVVFEASGIKAGGEPASSSRGGGDTEGGVLVKGQNMKRRGGSGGRIDHRKRGGRVKGNQRLFDWQVGKKVRVT